MITKETENRWMASNNGECIYCGGKKLERNYDYKRDTHTGVMVWFDCPDCNAEWLIQFKMDKFEPICPPREIEKAPENPPAT